MRFWGPFTLSILVLSSALAQGRTSHVVRFDVDSCLNDIKKVEMAASCLFGGSNSDCQSNVEAFYEAEGSRAKDFWKEPLPGASLRLSQLTLAANNYQIPSPSFFENMAPYLYRMGVTPPSYLLDAVMVARYGVMAGSGLSWAAYVLAIYLPDKGAKYVCDHSSSVNQIAINPVCHKSVLRPQAYELLRLTPQERYQALTNGSSKFYGARFQICSRYFSNLAKNVDYSFKIPILNCEPTETPAIFGEPRPALKFRFQDEDHYILNGEIWWEQVSKNPASYVLKPVDEKSNRNYHQMVGLYAPVFRDEYTRVALRDSSRRYKEGVFGAEIVSENTSGPPPSERHLLLWMNRARVYKACGLPANPVSADIQNLP